ncbi:MAG TPA: pirin family protein [Flavobacterium sp.]|nr:pirin family protein [Flavobacterium sp.]
MSSQHQAQIYKADQRGRTESEIFRRFATFNYGDYKESSRVPFGLLLALNDETLGAGNKIFRFVETDADIILLPLVGGVKYKDSLGNEDIVETNQIRIFSAKKGTSYQLENQYEKDLVNFLQIWIKNDKREFVPSSKQRDFDLKKNELISIFGIGTNKNPILETNERSYGFIGIYEGRKEGVYKMRNPKNGLFAFVINGAFEFDNRLIESRDGLAIKGADTIAFEALSENAMLLLLEIPLNQ